MPVAGQPDVALHAVGALVERAQVRRERVLGQRVGATTVREHQRSFAPHRTGPADRSR
jgi:hypothetical protein